MQARAGASGFKQPMRRSAAALYLLALACGAIPLRTDGAPDLPPQASEALAQSDDLEFTGRFCIWLESLDAKRIAPARTAVLDGSPAARRQQALALLDRRWAALNADGFLADCIVRRKDRDPQAQATALLAAFARDRDAAMHCYEELPLRDDPRNARVRFLLKAAPKDPAWLVRRCQLLPEWDAEDALVPSNLYIAWADSDPATAWVEMLKEPSYEARKTIGFRLLIGQLGKPPEQSAAWLRATPRAIDRGEIADAFFGTLNNT